MGSTDSGRVNETDEAEVVDGLPVAYVEATPVAPAGSGELAVVGTHKVAALAATGFVAGAAPVAVVNRRRGLPRRKRRRKGGLGEIVASNSFLVDVHLIRRP